MKGASERALSFCAPQAFFHEAFGQFPRRLLDRNSLRNADT